MRVAALDFGTNSFLCLIAEAAQQKVSKIIVDDLQIVRLGQGIYASNRFHPEALERADKCMQHFRALMDAHGVQKVMAVATSAARDVENSDEFIQLAKKHQIPVQIISGVQEAELTYRGAIFGRPHLSNSIVVDVGGGSTEIIYKQESGIVGRSFDVGCVRLLEKFVSQHPVSAIELINMIEFLDAQFAPLAEVASRAQTSGEVVAVAGTPTTLAAMDLEISFSEDKIDGYQLIDSRIQGWVDRLSKLSLAQRSALPGLDPKRADVIVVGALILSRVLKALNRSSLTVSTKGVRYGLIESPLLWGSV